MKSEMSTQAMTNERDVFELEHSDAVGQFSNRRAHEGYAYECMHCGKKSRDEFGNEPIDRGFDESCTLNCRLVKL